MSDKLSSACMDINWHVLREHMLLQHVLPIAVAVDVVAATDANAAALAIVAIAAAHTLPLGDRANNSVKLCVVVR